MRILRTGLLWAVNRTFSEFPKWEWESQDPLLPLGLPGLTEMTQMQGLNVHLIGPFGAWGISGEVQPS